MLSFSLCVEKSNIVGVFGAALPIKSSRMIAIPIPAHAMFFCTPP